MPESNLSSPTADEMRRHRELQAKSGLTIEAYCKRENLRPSSWWYWRKRLLSKRVSNPVQAAVSFLQVPTPPPETQKIDITLPNGSRITMPVSCDSVIIRRTIRILAPLRPR